MNDDCKNLTLKERVWNAFRCRALSVVCLVAPIVFGVVVMPHVSTWALGIDLTKIEWNPLIIEPKANAEPPVEAPPAPGSKPEQSVKSKFEQPTEDLTIRPLARQLAGRLKYAAAWGVYLVACATGIMITIGVLGRFLNRNLSFWLICLSWLVVSFILISIIGVDKSRDWLAEPVRDKFVVSVFCAGDLKQPYLGISSSPINRGKNDPCTQSDSASTNLKEKVEAIYFNSSALERAASWNTTFEAYPADSGRSIGSRLIDFAWRAASRLMMSR